ncbi:DUF952 domain-containing protein [Rhodococcoides yunnanense]|jgi:uncharacterized protein (DUF952 family)|uniref:DUF952 domain-containing protein n=1 Tax=Rhodococcoides yunnanense TaxID=278209 RepID=UPI0022B09F26|nr:DUF952 domain-containing protein [Rhodococcus yunnanensis]MCZ4274554.1 DUF952 domain-containing protein [Rhodococcus yunnanensis]
MGAMDDSRVLLHIISREYWLGARSVGEIRPDSLADVGFVHLSTAGQVHLPANRLFFGRKDMVLLLLDTERLDAPVRWEPGVPQDPDSMLFPHLYGPVPTAAVTDVVDYLPDASGMFTAPPDLNEVR